MPNRFQLLLMAAGRYKLLLLLIFTILISLVAYRFSGTQEEEVAITPFPTPLLTPAVEFADGVSKVPDGYVLFVQSWTHAAGEGKCDEAMIDYPDYEFSNDRLSGFLSSENPTNRSRVIIGTGASLGGAAGGGISSGLKVVDRLPYSITGVGGPYQIANSSSKIILRSVERNGALVAEIDGRTFWINPDSSWEVKVKWLHIPACWITKTNRLENYGLLPDKHVDIKWRGGRFQPGMVQPTSGAAP